MPDTNPLASLYPQPPAPPANLLSDPSRVIDMARGVGALSLLPLQREQLQTQIQGGQIQNATALAQQYMAQRDWLGGQLTGLAAKAQSGKKITEEDIHHWTAGVSRDTDPRAPPSSVLNQVADSIMSHPGGPNAGVLDAYVRALGPGAAAQPVSGPPSPGTGRPTQQSLGVAISTPAGGGGMRETGLGPGESVSPEAMAADVRAQGNFAQEIALLHLALDAYNKLKEKYPGGGFFAPGSKGRQEFESYIQGISPGLARAVGIDPEKLKEFGKASKYLTEAMASRIGGLGAGTVEQLKVGAGASPNVDINDLTVGEILPMMIARARMGYVQTQAAAAQGPLKYTYTAARLAAQQNPHAYMVDLMTPEQRSKLYKSMSPAELKRFNASLKAAIDSGVIQHPSYQPPGQ
jgi:hypothetical protein